MNLIAASTSFWLIFAPYLTLGLAVIGLVAAFYPQYKDHRKNLHQRARREERIDATCDAVLGCPADYVVGKAAQKGLVDSLAEIQQLNQEGVRLTKGLTKKVDDHIVEDKQEFERVWRNMPSKTS